MKHGRTKLAMFLAIFSVGSTVTNGLYWYPSWKSANSRYEELNSDRRQATRSGSVFEKEAQLSDALRQSSDARRSVKYAGLWSAGAGFLGLLLGLFGLIQKEGGQALAAMLLSLAGGVVGIMLTAAV
jgi:hypothetical protein